MVEGKKIHIFNRSNSKHHEPFNWPVCYYLFINVFNVMAFHPILDSLSMLLSMWSTFIEDRWLFREVLFYLFLELLTLYIFAAFWSKVNLKVKLFLWVTCCEWDRDVTGIVGEWTFWIPEYPLFFVTAIRICKTVFCFLVSICKWRVDTVA